MTRLKKMLLPLMLVVALLLGTIPASAVGSPVPMKDCTVSVTKSVVYNAKAQTPAVTVKDKDGKKVNAQYYSVKYTNNVKVGTATVTVKGKAPYVGTVEKTFKIEKQTPVFTTKGTVKYSKTKKGTVTVGDMVKGDYGLGGCSKASGSSKLSITKGGNVKVKKGTKKGKYRITVKFKGNANVKSGSAVITITVK